MRQLFGVYIGQAVGGGDPDRLGRIRVTVPSLAVSPSWAPVCNNAGSRSTGDVVVAFEAGDPARPIVLGFL
jgi:Type VI secretion system/phage-baseplate injector OB domain